MVSHQCRGKSCQRKRKYEGGDERFPPACIFMIKPWSAEKNIFQLKLRCKWWPFWKNKEKTVSWLHSSSSSSVEVWYGEVSPLALDSPPLSSLWGNNELSFHFMQTLVFNNDLLIHIVVLNILICFWHWYCAQSRLCPHSDSNLT